MGNDAMRWIRQRRESGASTPEVKRESGWDTDPGILLEHEIRRPPRMCRLRRIEHRECRRNV